MTISGAVPCNVTAGRKVEVHAFLRRVSKKRHPQLITRFWNCFTLSMSDARYSKIIVTVYIFRCSACIKKKNDGKRVTKKPPPTFCVWAQSRGGHKFHLDDCRIAQHLKTSLITFPVEKHLVRCAAATTMSCDSVENEEYGLRNEADTSVSIYRNKYWFLMQGNNFPRGDKFL